MSATISLNPKKPRVLVACGIIKPELEMLRKKDDPVEIRYLDQGLHRFPKKMPSILQHQVDQAAKYAGAIILGYGLCSNGTVGVMAPDQGLFIPRCHDCITFSLGSSDAYLRALKTRPGTYYLTAGWIKARKDPLSIVEDEYIPRLGRETAIWGMQQELKYYTHIAFINTGLNDPWFLRQRTSENAKFFKKTYIEIQGNLEYFKKLLYGPYLDEPFIFLEPGECIRQHMFLNAQVADT